MEQLTGSLRALKVKSNKTALTKLDKIWPRMNGKRRKVTRGKNNQTLKVFAKHPRNEVEGATAFRIIREHPVFP
jgi:hypothetical protein